jgi:hypothetical protein
MTVLAFNGTLGTGELVSGDVLAENGNLAICAPRYREFTLL